MSTGVIRTESVLRCPLCGKEERGVLHSALKDRLFGAPGEWSLKECCHCGLVFLDPRPIPEDIGKAYATYYTHSSSALPDTLIRRLRHYVRSGYLESKLGYATGATRLQRIAGWLAYLHPEQREVIESSVMYLPAKDRGRLLEIGFGTGEALSELRHMGWEVQGVDFDAQAVEIARLRYGLDVRLGSLENQRYSSNHFDVVTMSHVIEHMHDPVALLKECHRILKPDGVIIVITPNVNSLSHRLFGRSWRGLEPPRHLALFSRETMYRAARDAGLSCALTTTVRGAYRTIIEARQLRSLSFGSQPSVPRTEKLRGHSYQYFVSLLLRFAPDCGEELLLRGTKDE